MKAYRITVDTNDNPYLVIASNINKAIEIFVGTTNICESDIINITPLHEYTLNGIIIDETN